jgi:kumamolisin
MKKKSLLGTVLSASMLFMSCAQAVTQKATDGANEGQGVVSLQNAQTQFPGSKVRLLDDGSIEIEPASSQKQPGETGFVAHTNLKFRIPPGNAKPPSMQEILANAAAATTASTAPVTEAGTKLTGPFETPASVYCVYSSPSPTKSGCSPTTSTSIPKGGSGAIAVVEAYDSSPNAESDLKTFSKQFGLPAPKLKIVYASGKRPASSVGTGWDVEEATDAEAAHTMAPDALIIVVEAASNSVENMYLAVDVATKLVKENGGGQVSMSFTADETSEELTYDEHFKETDGIVDVAAAGDDPQITGYPAASPFVIAVGGTAFIRTLNAALDFLAEAVWYTAPEGQSTTFSTSGGKSLYEPRPSFQEGVKKVTGAWRGIPDAAAFANGFWFYMQGQWGGVSGTSLSAPLVAGIINNTHSEKGAVPQNQNTTYAEVTKMYDTLGTPLYPKEFNDITQGSLWSGVPTKNGYCGPNGLTLALKGYNLCDGLGSPKL